MYILCLMLLNIFGNLHVNKFENYSPIYFLACLFKTPIMIQKKKINLNWNY